ncbi:ABC transporter ATP-binding protein [bacterium]|nr:ABC transporter ATP-binding protein [candidate division CSSED10-310 bacterium]
MNAIISVSNLIHQFGRTIALNGAGFSVPGGSVTGLLGPNGSGKTTAIHILIGILRRTGGAVTVLGMDPDREAVAIRRRVGFVPEDPHGEPLFTVRRQLAFQRAFYPAWDRDLEERMVMQLDLDTRKPVKNLSRGERAKLALVGALSPRPELLILDDPTLGLDPVARREFIEGMVAVLAEEGRTVFFSTHHMQDIERVADRVVMLNHGRTILEGELETIRQAWRSFRLVFPGAAPVDLTVPGMFRWIPEGRTGRIIFSAYSEESRGILEGNSVTMESLPFDLEEIFVENAGAGKRRMS